MNNKFHGWKTVFGFTFKKATGKGYKAVTSLIALLIIGIIVLINVLAAKPDEEDKPSPITMVSVYDESGLQPTDFGQLIAQVAPVQFSNVTFTYVDGMTVEEALKNLDGTTNTGVLVHITKIETGYQLEAMIPVNSTISEGESSDLVDQMITCFQTSKMMQAGLEVNQLTTLLRSISTSYQSVGEETDEVVMVIKMVLPMLFGLIMYMLLMLHGQNVCKAVSTEKTSKLMETLLTSVHPYALITGKVLAISCVAIIQFVTWILAVVVGLYGGNAIAHTIYPEYENTVVTIINFLRDNIGESALSLESVIIAIIIFCIGFLFYCVLAGLAGCIVSKPEDAANAQGIFIFPILISWLVCYLSSAAENTAVLSVARYIPFTIPFSVPVDLITGTISIGQGIISLIILALFSLVFIMLSARIYKGLILYNGEKISFKKMAQVLRAKQ